MFRSFLRIRASDGMIVALLQALDFLLPRWLFAASAGEILRKDLTCRQPSPGTFHIRWATAEDLARLRQFSRHIPRLDDWIAHGDRFAVAIRDDEIAGFENYRSQVYQLPRMPWVRVCLGRDEIWAVSSYIAPKYRAQGVARDILAFAARRLGDEGFTAIYDHVFEADGRASKAHAKRGFIAIDRWR
ncbi:MAG: GNAT family N-acetyltransferase, partial [Alphaproteobacteria bacterium]